MSIIGVRMRMSDILFLFLMGHSIPRTLLALVRYGGYTDGHRRFFPSCFASRCFMISFIVSYSIPRNDGGNDGCMELLSDSPTIMHVYL